ncbi:hypothetical protein RFI_29403, partial [Reticulomyxa filosa]
MQRLIQRAFFYLEFPSSFSSLFELKADVVPKEIQDLMIAKLKLVLVKNIHVNFIINEIKKIVEQVIKRSQPSFIQAYQTFVDNLIIFAWIRVLLPLYENCYLQVFLFAIKKKVDSRQELINIFVASVENEALVPLFDEDKITDLELHVWKVKVCYKACFPFSWNFHMWCLDKLQIISDDNDKVLETCALLKSKSDKDGDDVFLTLNQCSREICEFYTKDVICGKFHAYFSMEESDQIAEILKDIVLCMVQMVIGEDSIPSIETVLYYFENVITKYVQLVFLFKDETVVISEIRETLSNCESTMPLEQLIM